MTSRTDFITDQKQPGSHGFPINSPVFHAIDAFVQDLRSEKAGQIEKNPACEVAWYAASSPQHQRVLVLANRKSADHC